MKIINLKLSNFRNYTNLELEFSNKQNIIIGPNGAGKTNIVEAIYVIALTKSFRGSQDKVLINSKFNNMKISATVKDKIINRYEIVISENGKTVKQNGNRVTKLSEHISKINIVLFTPEDTNAIKYAPKIRRNMINIAISQLYNEYLHILNDYNKILKQRNAYLKLLYTNNLASKDYLQILTDKLIDVGIKICEYRKKFVIDINNYLDKINYDVTKKKGLKLSYVSSFKNHNFSSLQKKYKSLIDKDLMLGKTSLGVHHDDFVFSLKGKNLKDYGSLGEQKNAMICFKLSQIELFIKEKRKYPILILDDMFSELDSKKYNNLLKKLNKNLQIFITTTDLNNINTKVLNNCTVFELKNEKVVKKVYE